MPMEEVDMMAGVEAEPIRRARIVPMVAPRYDDIPTQAG